MGQFTWASPFVSGTFHTDERELGGGVHVYGLQKGRRRGALGLNWGLGRGKTRQGTAEQAEPGKAKGRKRQCACFFPLLGYSGLYPKKQ